MKTKTKKSFLYSSLVFVLLLPTFYLLFLYFGIKNNFVFLSKTDSLFKGFCIKSINQEIKTDDIIRFKSPNKDITLGQSSYLIKKVKEIKEDKLFVIGKSKEELFNQYHIEGLISYDSYIFGLIDKKDCLKVKELKLTNKILKFIKAL